MSTPKLDLDLEDSLLALAARPTFLVERELPPDLLGQVREHAKNARAPLTNRAYEQQWRRFEAWAQAHGRNALPADPLTLAAYITARAAEGRRPSTLGQAIAAIAHCHRLTGLPPPHKHPGFQETWNGIRRDCGLAMKASVPLKEEAMTRTANALAETVEVAPWDERDAGRSRPPYRPEDERRQRSWRLHELRERALLFLAFFSALRRSNLAILNVEDLTWGEKTLGLYLTHSKVDQFGRGRTVGIPLECEAPAALGEWLAEAQIEHGAIFRQISCWGEVGERLHASAVRRIVRRCASTRYTAHSLRSGFATTAHEGGATLKQIMHQGGWATLSALSHYIQPEDGPGAVMKILEKRREKSSPDHPELTGVDRAP